MKKLIPFLLVVAIAALIAAPAFTQVTRDEFESVINLEGTVESLATLVATGAYDEIDVDRYYILEGSVASTQIFSGDPEAFQGVIELVSSSWVGLERIEAFHIYVLVEGPEFAARLPDRMPSRPDPRIITPNQRLVVIGPFIGTAMLNETTEVAVIQAITVR